jgi:5-oxoprolinase (ATP-hydrolysing) subunit A
MSAAPGTARTVSLNTDVGEGFGVWTLGDDDALLEIVTNANVACGFHAGDPTIMRRICAVAARNGVGVGAQVSYRDLAGFGRHYQAVPRERLVNDLLYQMGALDGFARAAGIGVTYVKAHGALYNAAARDTEQAEAIAEAVRLFNPGLPVLCQVGTAAWRAAEQAGLTPVAEVFVDRGYTAEGLLAPRGGPKSLVTAPEIAAQRAVRMVLEGNVESVDGTVVEVTAQSLCVHSDTPNAVAIARATSTALRDNGVRVAWKS